MSLTALVVLDTCITNPNLPYSRIVQTHSKGTLFALENLFPEAVDAVATHREFREVLDKTFDSRYKETFTDIHKAVTLRCL